MRRAPALLALELRQVSKEFAGHAAVHDVSLSIARGEFFSLLGPSGCGKSTTLRLVAGFEQPSAGSIRLAGEEVTHKPVAARDLNLVFQNYALFPHLTVADNVAFGLRMQKVASAEITRRVAEALAMVHLTGLERRLPRQLSGGQQQRAALARALVTRPALLLLDEPLGALDLKLRRAMQAELKGIQRALGMTFLYVTHDQEEALAMSDRVAVMRGGRVLQIDTPQRLYERPANRFVAEFIGESNFVTATALDHAEGTLRVLLGRRRVELACARAVAAGSAVTLTIRPEKVVLRPASKRARGPWLRGVVTQTVFLGTDTRYQVRVVDGPELLVQEQNRGAPAYAVGDTVSVDLPVPHLQVLEADGD